MLPQLQVPRQLGSFRVLRLLGRGGQGCVYLAEQGRSRRPIALKLLHRRHATSPGVRARFRREVEVVARLRHPNIVPLYESGEVDGRPYFTMRYVPGAALRSLDAGPNGESADWHFDTESTRIVDMDDWIGDAGAKPPATGDELDGVVGIVEKVARALHFAHERGVVHRDVKPSNIVVGDDHEPYLVDFGLAEQDGHAPAGASEVVGSFPFMAPELVGGCAGRTDRRTDIYSLGVTAFELLCGRRPHRGPSQEELFRQILHDAPPAPHDINPEVGVELESVILRCLAKDPAARHGTAEQLADDLARVRVSASGAEEID